ncbi:MAG: hypothetical protein WCP06_11905 [Verrucomicrobiota bacterium]
MNPAIVGTLIAIAVIVSFFAGHGRGRWWILGLVLALIAVGGGGMWLMERGPQKVFRHSPISGGHLAWLFSTLAILGFGGFVGLMIRCALGIGR